MVFGTQASALSYYYELANTTEALRIRIGEKDIPSIGRQLDNFELDNSIVVLFDNFENIQSINDSFNDKKGMEKSG